MILPAVIWPGPPPGPDTGLLAYLGLYSVYAILGMWVGEILGVSATPVTEVVWLGLLGIWPLLVGWVVKRLHTPGGDK